MEYDHDNIANNHNMPQVAFMVNTNEKVETKHFNKDQYDETQKYQLSFVNNKEYSRVIEEEKNKVKETKSKIQEVEKLSKKVIFLIVFNNKRQNINHNL